MGTLKSNNKNGCAFFKSSKDGWVRCSRLGIVRSKTCETCVFNKNNKDLKKKASKYYRL